MLSRISNAVNPWPGIICGWLRKPRPYILAMRQRIRAQRWQLKVGEFLKDDVENISRRLFLSPKIDAGLPGIQSLVGLPAFRQLQTIQ